MSNTVVKQTSFPFFSILFLIFLTLKLTGHIAWSWWLVTLPLWGPIAFVFAFVALLAVGVTIFGK